MNPELWTVTARNLPEHARNPIHTDDGAQAAGFPRALVAGVTTYAYLTHPIAAAWDEEWIAGGAAEVRFRRPVFDGDLLRCRPRVDPATDIWTVEARTDEPEQPRAVLTAARHATPWQPRRAGEDLAPLTVTLEGEWGSDYGARAGEDLEIYARTGWVHPAVWPALANQITHTQVARGSWIHMRSLIAHHAAVPAGTEVTVWSRVVRRWEQFGERALLDVHILTSDSPENAAPLISIEHEAIVALPDSTSA